ncbi:MAG: hypothetical protein GTO14_12785 [Anaerolineales bacterium]|nr:hypothetical protein [Anaerolineales bacterium]
MTPVVDGLKAEYEGLIAFLTLDAASGEGKRAFEDYGLPGHPSYILLDINGDVTWRAFGPQPREALQDAIENALLPSEDL